MGETDLIASTGVGLLLLAFVLNQRGVLSDRAPAFLWMNLLGAAIAAYAAWLGRMLPFVVLEGVWALVAGWGLWRLWQRRGTAVQ